MSGIDRVRGALRREEPEEVPAWELEFHLWNAFSSRRMVIGAEFAGLSPALRERALRVNAEVMASVALELGFSAVTVPGTYWEIAPGHPAFYWLPEESAHEQIRLLRALAGDAFLLAAGTPGIISMPASKDYLEFSYKLFDSPELVDKQAADTLAAGIDRARRLREHGVEIFFNPADIADNHGLFFNPDQMNRFILPYLGRWADEIRKLGGWSVLHSDGNLDASLNDLARSGIDGLQAVDPVAGMDMLETKRKVEGKLCLCGNIDCGLLVSGAPERVYDAARSLIRDCAPGGGFILGASNAVQPDVPPENYRALVAARASG